MDPFEFTSLKNSLGVDITAAVKEMFQGFDLIREGFVSRIKNDLIHLHDECGKSNICMKRINIFSDQKKVGQITFPMSDATVNELRCYVDQVFINVLNSSKPPVIYYEVVI
jgi:hypothetical protein